jgi:ElaB/YqjD/DUF883 family membrane-anchored ribosome-binding protein
MSNALNRQLQHDIDDTLQDVAKALHSVADDLADDAETGVAQAAKALRHAASVMAEKTPPQVKTLARKAAEEVRQHPVASTAAALTAAAALIGLLASTRRKPAA